MRDYLSLIDRNTDGIRCDVTPLFTDPEAFESLLDDLIKLLAECDFTTIVAIDALGFILGTGLAVRSHKPLVVVRKAGKLPLRMQVATFVDYTGRQKSLELRSDAVRAGARVLVADDWVETGGQVLAAISLVEKLGGVVVGVTAINIDNAANAALTRLDYKCFSISNGGVS